MTKSLVVNETPSTTDSGTDSLLVPPQTTESDPSEERKHKYPVRSRHGIHATQQQLTVSQLPGVFGFTIAFRSPFGSVQSTRLKFNVADLIVLFRWINR